MTSTFSPTTRLVFDTNVLVSAFVFRGKAKEIYHYCAERHTIVSTEWLLAELQDVLSREKFGLPVLLQREILAQIRFDSQLVHPNNDLPTDSVDPDDNYVLQAALFVDASFLITGDTKHLLPLRKIGSTAIISPTNFYERFIRYE